MTVYKKYCNLKSSSFVSIFDYFNFPLVLNTKPLFNTRIWFWWYYTAGTQMCNFIPSRMWLKSNKYFNITARISKMTDTYRVTRAYARDIRAYGNDDQWRQRLDNNIALARRRQNAWTSVFVLSCCGSSSTADDEAILQRLRHRL